MKIFCIGRNYAAHAAELANEVPDQPLIFMKPPTAILDHDRPFYHPDFSQNIHYELELVVRIKKNGKDIAPKFVANYYDQVGLGIDFTARDLQDKLKAKGHPWEIAKAFDHSAVISKFIPLEGDIQDLHFRLLKNDEVVQQGHTALMIYDVNTLICYLSKYFTLSVGDLIYTGTPAGVGPVKIGDTLVAYLGDQKLLECTIK